MSSLHIGMIFGSLLVHKGDPPERILVLHQNEAVQMMIDKYEEIFYYKDKEWSSSESESSSRKKAGTQEENRKKDKKGLSVN